MKRKFKSKRSSRGRSFGIDRTTDPPTAWRRTAGGGYTTHELGSKIDMYGATAGTATQEQRMARARDRFVGWGDYRRAGRTALRAGGALAGGILGGMTGGVGGAFRGARGGWSTGARASKFLGLGDYAANQIMPGGRQPMSVNGSSTNLTGDVTVSHREFIGNVSADALTFQNRSYPINPGLSETFPFLSQIAQNFTMYQFEGLIFEFVSTSGETSTSTNALGKVILAVDYDPDAAPFQNAIQMSNMDYAVSSRPSDSIRCGVETAPAQMATKMQFIRTGVANRDKIFTDIGRFQLATDGVPATGILGELWVAYTCRLSRAQLSITGFGSNIKYDSIFWHSGAAGWFDNPAVVAASQTLNIQQQYTSLPNNVGLRYTGGGDYLGGTMQQISTTVAKYTFPVKIGTGTYFVLIRADRGPTALVCPSITPTFVGAKLLCPLNFPGSVILHGDDTTTSVISVGNGNTTGNMIFGMFVQVDTTSSVPASITFTASSTWGTEFAGTFTISQMNSSMTGRTVI